ncbi:MAG: DUF2061 domain-containing protein [Candidatus Levyibacteriota bacterium]
MKEKPTRSVIKAVMWRIIATLTTSILVLVFTHKWELALTVGGIDGVLKLFFYYLHERVWNEVSWGKAKTLQNKDIF